MKDITVDEYCKIFIPQAGLILIDKDGGPEGANGLVYSKSTRALMTKWSGTGIIKVMSPFMGETEHDKYLHTLYKVGDHVAFNTINPIDVPKPPDMRFKDPNTALVLIHIADLLGAINDAEFQESQTKNLESQTKKSTQKT